MPIAALAWLATEAGIHLLTSCNPRYDRCFTANDTFVVALVAGTTAFAVVGACHLLTIRRAPRLGLWLTSAIAALWAIAAVLLCLA